MINRQCATTPPSAQPGLRSVGTVVSLRAAGLPRCAAVRTLGVTLLTPPDLSLREGAAVLALVGVQFIQQLHFSQGLALLHFSSETGTLGSESVGANVFNIIEMNMEVSGK